MISRSKKHVASKPLVSLVQPAPPAPSIVPSASSLLVSSQQPRGVVDGLTLEQELQALRAGQTNTRHTQSAHINRRREGGAGQRMCVCEKRVRVL